MKKFVPYIVFASLTAFTATGNLPLMADGCSSHRNKKAEIECVNADTDCKTDEIEKFDLKNSKNLKA